MSARRTYFHLAAKAGMLFGALFVVTVLLAAIPAHHTPSAEAQVAQESSGAAQEPDQSTMPGMNMSDEKASEKAAVNDMTPGHHEGHALHMFMTAMRPQT